MSSGLFEKAARRVFIVSVTLFFLSCAFVYGAIAFRNNLPPIRELRVAYKAITDSNDAIVVHPRRQHLQPSRGQGSGVTVNSKPDDGKLVFMAGFFDEENQIRLIGRDGTVVRKWSLDYFEHFPDREDRVCDRSSPLRVDTHGAHVTPQGDVVFNYEYCGSVKLDQCGRLKWSISRQTHHSLVPAASGGYWILGRDIWLAREQPDRFPPFSAPALDQLLAEDTLLRVSEDGEVREEFSIPALMRENGMEAVLTVNQDSLGMKSAHPMELVHANKATELSAAIADAFPLFEAGDIAISMRNLNLVMVIDPVTKKVKWHQTGPWLRQHDPEFRADGRLSIFNNNVYISAYVANQTVLSTPHITNIMAVDPVSGATEVIFGGQHGQEMLSVIRGQHELLDDGGMIVTEFDAGRVIEVDVNGQIVWEYVNFYDEKSVGEITNATVIPADYFKTEWQNCSP